jgi:hypothetical protein
MDCFKLNDKFHGSQSCRCSKLLIKCALVHLIEKLFDILIFICNVLNAVFLFSYFESNVPILFPYAMF